MYVEFYDAAKVPLGLNSGGIYFLSGVGYPRLSHTYTTPAGAVFGKLIVVAFSGSVTQVVGYRFKNEWGTEATPFSDEATTGALYGNGVDIDTLKPAEVGANVTETRTAAAIAGQGSLATLSQATWATHVTGAGKPEDYATKSLVYRQTTEPGSPGVNDIWFQTNGAGALLAVYAWTGSIWKPGPDVTGLNTAAAIAGQGALATVSQANWATQVTGTGKPADYANVSLVYRQTTEPGSPTVNDIWFQMDGAGDLISVSAWNGSIWKKGSDLTGLNVAAGFAGQGSMATVTPPTHAGNTAALTAGLMPGDFFSDSTDGNKKKAVVAAGTSAFDVTLSTALAVGYRSGTGSVDSESVTATAVGGSGYAYQWAYLSGDSFTISHPTASETYFTGAITSLGQTLEGFYRLTTRDGGSGRVLLRDERVILSENS
jgi:hypothetical protein